MFPILFSKIHRCIPLGSLQKSTKWRRYGTSFNHGMTSDPINSILFKSTHQSLDKNSQLRETISSYGRASLNLLELGLNDKELKMIQHIQLGNVIAEMRPVFRDPDNRDPGEAGAYQFSPEFSAFAAVHNLDVPAKTIFLCPEDSYFENNGIKYEDIYQAVIQFGKEICIKHPIVFRDLYLAIASQLPLFFAYVQDFARDFFMLHMKDKVKTVPAQLQPKTVPVQLRSHALFHEPFMIKYDIEFRREWVVKVLEWIEDWDRWESEEIRTLMAQLTLEPESDWFKFSKGNKSRLPWSMFFYIRTLPSTPFDPIKNTNEIDPYLREKVYEKVGLLAAADKNTRLDVTLVPKFAEYDSWLQEHIQLENLTYRCY